MIIDFHTHTFPDDLAEKALSKLRRFAPGGRHYTDGTVADLRRSMTAAGIDVSVTLPVATKPSQVPAILEACRLQAGMGVLPFAGLHPSMADGEVQDAVAAIKAAGVKGIKLHPEYQDFYVDQKRHFPMYEALQSAGLIVVFHAGKDPGPFTCDHALPRALRAVHEAFPQLVMVASHLGGWKLWDDVEKELIGTTVCLDTAAVSSELPPAAVAGIINRHGADRVLFGTDSPWFDQSAEVKWIDSLPLSSEQKDAILWRNAVRLLGGAAAKTDDAD